MHVEHIIATLQRTAEREVVDRSTLLFQPTGKPGEEWIVTVLGERQHLQATCGARPVIR
jgi:hypothetical protein